MGEVQTFLKLQARGLLPSKKRQTDKGSEKKIVNSWQHFQVKFMLSLSKTKLYKWSSPCKRYILTDSEEVRLNPRQKTNNNDSTSEMEIDYYYFRYILLLSLVS